ncbi:TniQ family protein [Streptomyces sp. NPDC048342]|uniref:TniQ family protein n=1 Tax=Streptomyces sp. NPDC048342 TaxID=3154716 RepID=UPI0034230BF1
MTPGAPGSGGGNVPPPDQAAKRLRRGLQRARPLLDERRPLPRRLPAVPLPRPGESLFSWVDHVATDYEVNRTEIMHTLGLEPRTDHAAHLTQYTAQLPVPAAQMMQAATGLSPAELRDMTLSGINAGPSRRKPYREMPWAPGETWAFCPKCLEPPGRWPLWWYQSWAVLCPVHDCYTASFCPDCGSPFSPSILRGDAAGRCPGFLSRPDERLPESPDRRRSKRKRCGRPLWEISTPPVADPFVRKVHQSLIAHLAAVRSGRPASTQQWFDDFRTLRILLSDPEPLHVHAFTSPDPALTERYTDQPADDGWGIDGDVIQWQPSESGFLHPWRQGAFGSRSKKRDPVTTAAEFSVIGRILSSDDMAAAARETFDVPHRADLRSFGDQLPSYLSRTSPQLHGLLRQALETVAVDQVLGPAGPPLP